MPKRVRKIKREITVSIIGAGRLGTALALALDSRGYVVEALVTRRVRRAQKSSRLFPGSVLALSETQLAELPASKLILIAAPDDIIPSVAGRLAIAQNGMRQGRTVLHTSGALSSEVLTPLRDVGFHVGSMHPLISVSASISGAANLSGAFFCLEGDDAAVRAARQVVRDLGGHSFTIDTRHKPLYHAAAVMASGHMTALFDIALEMLVHSGLSPQRAREILLPLIASTVSNLSANEPARALTGTFARADITTVQRHLDVLRQLPSRDALDAYTLLGRRSVLLAKKSGADATALREVTTKLKETDENRPKS
jgi:predicted short-subunit dehydrogenase-like oxidoreductase (DUF2520 family)